MVPKFADIRAHGESGTPPTPPPLGTALLPRRPLWKISCNPANHGAHTTVHSRCRRTRCKTSSPNYRSGNTSARIERVVSAVAEVWKRPRRPIRSETLNGQNVLEARAARLLAWNASTRIRLKHTATVIIRKNVYFYRLYVARGWSRWWGRGFAVEHRAPFPLTGRRSKIIIFNDFTANYAGTLPHHKRTLNRTATSIGFPLKSNRRERYYHSRTSMHAFNVRFGVTEFYFT